MAQPTPQPPVQQKVPPQTAHPAVTPAAQSQKLIVKPSQQKHPKKPVDWLFAAAVLLVLVCAALLYILDSKRNEYISAKKEDADRIQVIQNASTFSQVDIQKVESAFLNEQEIIEFIQKMEQTKVWFESFDLRFTSDIAQGKEIKYLPFTLIIHGEKVKIDDFLTKLLNSTYVIEPEQLEIVKDKEIETNENITLTGRLYVSEKLK